MRKVSEIVVLAGENCGSQLFVSSLTNFLKTIHHLSMPNGNLKKKFDHESLLWQWFLQKCYNKTFSTLNENRVLNKGKPTISRAFRQWNFTVQQYVYWIYFLRTKYLKRSILRSCKQQLLLVMEEHTSLYPCNMTFQRECQSTLPTVVNLHLG